MNTYEVTYKTSEFTFRIRNIVANNTGVSLALSLKAYGISASQIVSIKEV